MRTIKIAFIAVMSLLLVLPAAEMIYPFVHFPGLEEYRTLTPFPDLLGVLKKGHARLAPSINKWFDDNMGFRPILTRSNNEVDYWIFDYSNKVFIGHRGWLFDKNTLKGVLADQKDPTPDQPILQAVRHLRDCLTRRGIELVFLLNTTKTSIYPEFLPLRLPTAPPRLARRLAKVLHDEPGLSFIDAEPILFDRKDGSLFYKTDMHMNLKASSYVYREMVSRIARITGKEVPVFAPEPWSPIAWNGGSEERFLAKFLPLTDTTYLPSSIVGSLANDNNGTFEFNVGNSELPSYPDLPMFEWIFRNKRPPESLLPPMVLFGTSYSDALFSLRYNEFFATIYRTRSNLPQRIGPLLSHLPADVKIFVVEYPEQALRAFLAFGQLPQCNCENAQCASKNPRS